MRISSRYTLLLGLPLAWLATGCANPPQTASTPPHAIRSEHAVSDARLRILAQEFERRGQYEEAAGLYQRSLQINPEQPDVRRKLQMLASRSRLHRKSAPGLMPTDTMLADSDADTAGTDTADTVKAETAKAGPETSGTDSTPVAHAASIQPATTPSGATPASATGTHEPVTATAERPVITPLDDSEAIAAASPDVSPARPFPGEAAAGAAAATGTAAAPAEPTVAQSSAAGPAVTSDISLTSGAVAEARPVITPVQSVQASSDELPQIIARPSTQRDAGARPGSRQPESAPAGMVAIASAHDAATGQAVASAAVPAKKTAEGSARIVIEDVAAPTTPAAAGESAAVQATATTTVMTESAWKPTSLTRLCKDAHAAVLSQVARLESDDPAIRKDALNQLARMGRRASTANLAVRTLRSDSDPAVRGHVAWALWCIDDDTTNSVEMLRELLGNDDPAIVQFACYLLGTIGADAASSVPDLEQLIARSSGATRLHAAEAAARIDGTNTAAIDVLISALSDEVVETRWLAAIALSSATDTATGRAIEALTAALADESADVRAAAALSLGGFGTAARAASASLASASETDNPMVRDAARTALACIAQGE